MPPDPPRAACRSVSLAVICLVLIGLAPAVARAQVKPQERGAGRVTGIIRDSITRAPILRATACVTSPLGTAYGRFQRCSAVDRRGRFTIDSLPAGTWIVSATCRGGSMFAGGVLADTQVTTAGVSRIDWNVATDRTDCDQRPLERTTRRFTGDFYTNHGDESWFFIDAREGAVAIADMSRSGMTAVGPMPNVITMPDHDGRCFRATLQGTLTGPFDDVGRPFRRFEIGVTRIVRSAPSDSTVCAAHIDRFLRQPDGDYGAREGAGLAAYLDRRFAVRGQRPVVVLCGAVAAHLGASEFARLRQRALQSTSSVMLEPSCHNSYIQRIAERGEVLIKIVRFHVDPFAPDQVSIWALSGGDYRGTSAEYAQVSRLDGALISVTFEVPSEER